VITSLTQEQMRRFPEFVEKWKAIGLSTEPANRKEAEIGVVEAYKAAGLDAPKIVWCGSPMSQGLVRAIVFNCVPSEVRSSVRDSVGASVWDSVWASVRDSVRASVWDSVRASVGDSVRASVGDSVGDSVWDSVGASVRDSVRDSVWDSVVASGYGQHDAGWLSFYDYFRRVCDLDEQTQKLLGIWRISRNAGWWLPHKKMCWVSERHNILNRDSQGRLHKDGGAALAYPDAWEIYALNGVRMMREHVMTPAEKLDPKKVLAESNVEVRRELIRKIGMERFMDVCPHKRLNLQGNYELFSIELTPELKDTRWLKMLNPSIGVWHVEAVAPECSTVQQAINWRAGQKETNWEPETLT